MGNSLRRLRIRILEQNVDSGEWNIGEVERSGVECTVDSGEAGCGGVCRDEAETRRVGRTAALCVDDALRYDMMRNTCFFCFNIFKSRTDSPEADQKRFWNPVCLRDKISGVLGYHLYLASGDLKLSQHWLRFK